MKVIKIKTTIDEEFINEELKTKMSPGDIVLKMSANESHLFFLIDSEKKNN